MKMNVGSFDRVARAIVGLVVLSAIFWVEGPVRWFGLAGLVLVGTGVFRRCPIYFVTGLNSCRVDTPAPKTP